ncbi:MAG: hypothetical protein ABSB52_04375 [Acidimicrobiales bacterium]|jgi:hypothetical protein
MTRAHEQELATVGPVLRTDDRHGGGLAEPEPARAVETGACKPGRLARRDALVVALFFGIPLIVLSVPALAGYPLITGDDLTQNYPLSVLSGQFIAHGHLPVYDPYLWSGTPLLAGASAHALLPSTLVFAFLPHLSAWVLAEALTLAAGAIGAFVLLRRNGCRTLAAALGGASFGFGGFVSSQIVHIDFVSASSSLVWCLVGLDGIARGEPRRRPAWALVLAAAVACIGLSGSPDIVIDTFVAVVVYGCHLLATDRPGGLARLAWAGAGGAAGLAASAVQWVPTAEFLAVTERAHVSLAFASSGSVSPAELLVSVVPHILGGGPIGLEAYTGPYNLSELDAYCGILSFVAIVTLLGRWRCGHARRWRVWYLVGGIGLLLALGSHTALEHLLVHMPVVGDQRLPSRALILFSLASSMLLGHWVEDQLASRPGRPRRLGVAGGLVVPVVVLGLVAATALSDKPYGGLLHALAGSRWSLSAVAPYLAVTALTALAASAIVVLGPSWPRRRLASAISALVIAELILFTANQSSLAPVRAQALDTQSPLQAQLAVRLGSGGRYLIVDPARSGGVALNDVGSPDSNVVMGLASAQGYGSLTWGPYADATGTHTQDDLDPAALATGVFDSLDVRVLLTVPDELSVPRSSSQVFQPATATLPGLGGPPLAGVGPVASPTTLRPGEAATRWFGRALDTRSVTVRLSDSRLPTGSLAEIGRELRLVSANGGKQSPTTVRVVLGAPGSETVVANFPTGVASVGVSTRNPFVAPVRIASLAVTARDGSSYGLDGPLSAYLTAPHWTASGTIGPFAAFTNERALGPFFLAGRTGTGGGALRVRVVSSSPWTATEEVAVSSARPARVGRAVADIPGWRATGVHDGRSSAISLERDGLVQSFEVPAGTTLVTFSYESPGLRAGLGASGLGVAAIIALGLAAAASSRRPEVPAEPQESSPSAGPVLEPERRVAPQ